MPKKLKESRYRRHVSFRLTEEEFRKIQIVSRHIRKSYNETVIEAVQALRFTPAKLFLSILVDLDRLARAEAIARSLGYSGAKEWLEISFEQSIDAQWEAVKETTYRPPPEKPKKEWQWSGMNTTPVHLVEGPDGKLYNPEDLDHGEEQSGERDRGGDEDPFVEGGGDGTDQAATDQGEFVHEEPTDQDD